MLSTRDIFLILSALILSACSGETFQEDVSVPQTFQEMEIAFLLDPDSGSGFFSTRNEVDERTFVPDGVLVPQNQPPRKILSSNNWQQVNDVRIYAFRKNGNGDFVYYKPLDSQGIKQNYISVEDFSFKFDISPYIVWWGGEEDLNESHAFIGKMNMQAGEYRFLALARDDRDVASGKLLTDPNVASPEWQWTAWTEGSTRLEDATLACARNYSLETTELFVGTTADTAVADGSARKIHCSITLERAVAGILLYVEHIPATMRAYTHDDNGTLKLCDVAVKSLAVVHGKTVSDQVRLHNRQAIQGRLSVTASAANKTYESSATTSSSASNPPLPAHVLLKADIPTQAQVQNGIYVHVSPDNTNHPNALLRGAFVMPQLANNTETQSSEKTYDKSLYLVFLGYDNYAKQPIALEWRPIQLASDDGNCDSFRYPIQANHFYSIGCRRFAANGTSIAAQDDKPIDLRAEAQTTITIQIDTFWNQYYGGQIGNGSSGVTLDPEWGEHPAGELQTN